MKRGIAILLAALLLSLCACSPTGADASEPGETQPATQPATRGTEPETTSEPPTQQSVTDATVQTPEEPEVSTEDGLERVGLLREEGLSLRDAVKRAAKELGLSRNELYNLALEQDRK